MRFFVLTGIPYIYQRIVLYVESMSDSQFGLLGGAGVTAPVSSDVTIRLQGRAQAMFSTRTIFSLLVGVSFMLD